MDLSNLLEGIKGTSKPSEKLDVLKAYECEELTELLEVTYDPFMLFNVSIKPKDIPQPGNNSINSIFNETQAVLRFCEKSKSNKQNREMVVSLLEKLNSGSQELLVGVLNKNWKAGLGTKSVLKLYPGLVSQFLVQLANTYSKDDAKHTSVPRWGLSYKLDGLRCVALREAHDDLYGKGRWTLYSRKGKKFITVEHLKPQLEALHKRYGWTFFDGELYKHGLTFEEIQGPVMAFTQGQVPTMDYHIFVAGEAKKFLNQEDPNHVDPLGGEQERYAPNIYFTHQDFVSSHEIEEKLEEAFELGYEGIMLREPDMLYDYKRSNALLKIKKSLSDEPDEEQGEIISDCVVKSIDYNDFFPVVEDGQLHTERLLKRIWVIQPDGIECKVGSGYSLSFRRYYTEHPFELIGKTVEVLHQGWGRQGRMRFPRFQKVREDL